MMRVLRLLGIAALLTLGYAPILMAQVVWQETWESGPSVIDQRFDRNGGCYPYSFDVVQDPCSATNNNLVLRIENRTGDDNQNCGPIWFSTRHRAELNPKSNVSDTKINYGDEVWWGFRVYLDSSWPTPPHPDFLTLQQFIPPPYQGVDFSLGTYMGFGDWFVMVPDGGVNQFIDNHEPGEWVTFVVHYRRHLTSGIVQVWKDGVQVIDFTGRTTEGTNNTHPLFWKWGIYMSKPVSQMSPGDLGKVFINYYDDFKFARGANQFNNVNPVGAACSSAIYASPSGSGSACSIGSPCSLSTAQSQASSGQTIILTNGQYGRFETTKSGITYQAQNQHQAVISHDGADGTQSPIRVMHDNTVIDGLYVTGECTAPSQSSCAGASGHGLVRVFSSSGFVLRNSIVERSQDTLVDVGGSTSGTYSNVLIEDNILRHSGYNPGNGGVGGEGVYVCQFQGNNTCSNITIRRNIFQDIGCEQAIDIKPNVSNVEITLNILETQQLRSGNGCSVGVDGVLVVQSPVNFHDNIVRLNNLSATSGSSILRMTSNGSIVRDNVLRDNTHNGNLIRPRASGSGATTEVFENGFCNNSNSTVSTGFNTHDNFLTACETKENEILAQIGQDPVDPPDGDITTGLIAYWPLNNSLLDQVGSTHLTYLGGTPFYETGQIGQGLLFNGATWATTGVHSIQGVSLFATPSQTWSVSAWFKGTSTGTIVASGVQEISQRDFQIAMSGSVTGRLDFYLRGLQTNSSVTTFGDGQWHHVVVTWDGSQATYYIDDTISTGSLFVGTDTEDLSEPIIFGARSQGTGYRLVGTLDDLRLYNRALSAADVATLFVFDGTVNPPGPPTNLTANPNGQLNWTASTGSPAIYHVERCTGVSCTLFAEIDTTPSTSYLDTSITSSTTYSYRVRAEDGSVPPNLGPYSNVATMTTPSPPPPPGSAQSFSLKGISLRGISVQTPAEDPNAGTFFVDCASGNDGLTCPEFKIQSTPALTLARALQCAEGDSTLTGDRIFFQGTCSEQVTISQSGTAGKPFVLSGVVGQTSILDGTGITISPTFVGLIESGTQDYLTFRDFEVRDSNTEDCISVSGTNITVDNVTAANCGDGGDRGSGIVLYNAATFSNNIVRNSTVTDPVRGGIICWQVSGGGVLFENNVVGPIGGKDNWDGIQGGNCPFSVVRNNVCHSVGGTGDCLDWGGNPGNPGTNHVVIENNVAYRGTGRATAGFKVNHEPTRVIVRKNKIHRIQMDFYEPSPTADTTFKLYNNTSVDAGVDNAENAHALQLWNFDGAFTGIEIVNNAFIGAQSYLITHQPNTEPGSPPDITLRGNAVKPGPGPFILWNNTDGEDTYSGDATGWANFKADELQEQGSGGVFTTVAHSAIFADADNRNFALVSGSPLIDVGENLTTTTGSGSGTSVQVVDSAYFHDGYGLVEGDTIVVGTNNPVQITEIDEGTHTLTVSSSITWSSGDAVNLVFSGSAPDIGANEFSP